MMSWKVSTDGEEMRFFGNAGQVLGVGSKVEIDGGSGAFLPAYKEKMRKIEPSVAFGEGMYTSNAFEIFATSQHVKDSFIQRFLVCRSDHHDMPVGETMRKEKKIAKSHKK